MSTLRALLLCSSTVFSMAHATVIEHITLKDGRQIAINDDYSWNVILTKDTASSSSLAHREPNAVMGTMTGRDLSAQALANPAWLSEVAAQGVKLKRSGVQQHANTLTLQVDVTNLLQDSVVQIAGSVSFYDQQGRWIADQEVKFWTAEYRLPESYLRSQQTRVYEVDAIPLPDKQIDPKLIRLNIRHVERR